MQIEYTQATTESFDGQPSHEDVIGKVDPEYIIPTGLTAMYGETLADVELPEGFEFQDSLETSVGSEKVNTFKVKYTPADTEKYNIVTDIEVTINVTFPTILSQITGADYGKSINYKATVQGQEVSNWKVFLNDGKNVYIILDDYLPNTLVPASTGLSKGDSTRPYSVWSSTNRDALVSALTTQSHWSEFANGAQGATATGGPTNAQFVASWNGNPAVNARKLQIGTLYYPDSPSGGRISDPTKLYVPHVEAIGNNTAYWLASPYTSDAIKGWAVDHLGGVYHSSYNILSHAVRPLVCLPANITGIVGETVEIK